VPLGFDALVIVLAATYDEMFWIFPPLFAAVSLISGAMTYWVGRTAGDAGLPRLVPAAYLERIKTSLSTTGSGALAAAAVMPPPFPLTPFLLTCGALGFDPRRFVVVFGVMRLVRFGAVALLARHYGSAVMQMLEKDGVHTAVTALGVAGAAAAILMGVALWSHTRPQPV
jgi:membrane protein YqaA with SNARE-associated domain